MLAQDIFNLCWKMIFAAPDYHLLYPSSNFDIAIVGIPDEKWGEIIAAFIKFRDKPILAKDLKLFSRQEMSPQKTPSIWVAVEQFPLTGSGKIQKFKLIEKFQSGQFQEMK